MACKLIFSSKRKDSLSNGQIYMDYARLIQTSWNGSGVSGTIVRVPTNGRDLFHRLRLPDLFPAYDQALIVGVAQTPPSDNFDSSTRNCSCFSSADDCRLFAFRISATSAALNKSRTDVSPFHHRRKYYKQNKFLP
jgi:hypothetical protein